MTLLTLGKGRPAYQGIRRPLAEPVGDDGWVEAT